jgi:hypothetical protein
MAPANALMHARLNLARRDICSPQIGQDGEQRVAVPKGQSPPGLTDLMFTGVDYKK